VEERVEELKKMIEEDQKKRKEIDIKFNEIKASEQLNTYGIMIGSVLTATVIEARELKSSKLAGNTNPYVLITVEGQSSQTEQISN
jgi:hypothetical protein